METVLNKALLKVVVEKLAFFKEVTAGASPQFTNPTHCSARGTPRTTVLSTASGLVCGDRCCCRKLLSIGRHPGPLAGLKEAEHGWYGVMCDESKSLGREVSSNY